MWNRLFTIFSLFVLAVQPVAAEKRWSIENVEIIARVDSAGYMRIEEKRAYRFWGNFSYAFYELPLAGLLDVDQIQVLETGDPYQLSEAKTPGTFLVERQAEKISIRWQFRGGKQHASGDRREFTLRFRVLGAVRVHRDVAELYYKFVGTGWERASANVRVIVQLPDMIRRDELRAWAHGPLHGTIAIPAGNRIEMAIAGLPRRQFWEARIIFPASYLAAAPATWRDDRDALPEILQQEARWAEEANRQREAAKVQQQWQENNRAQYASWLWFGLAAGVLFGLYMYQRYGRSLRQPQTRTIAEPPTDLPPAVANYVWNAHQLNGGALLATLFDLASRNFLRLQHTKTSAAKSWWGFTSTQEKVTIFFDEDKWRFHAGALLPYERQLLEFLRTDIAQNRSQLDLEQITKQAAVFRRFFPDWRKAVALQAGNPQLYDSASWRASLITLCVWLILMAVNIFAIHAMGEAAAPFAIASLCLAPCSFLILRYDQPVANKLDRLKSFRDYLKRFPQTYQTVGTDWQRVDRLLVYAVALGLSSTQAKPLFDVIERERGNAAFPWFVYHSGSVSTSLGSAMAAVVNVVGATMSSASGAGGGASAGGGGGAGGSGGGAG